MDSVFSPLPSSVKKIGFFGIGKTNLALLKFLPLDGKEIILRSDKKIDTSILPDKIIPTGVYEGHRSLDDIEEDILLLSPSFRRDRLYAKKSSRTFFSSDAELFFSGVNAPVFAISGSDGKSTTATLASLILSKNMKNAPLIGNIGAPMLPALSPENQAYVTELSSFTLTYITPKAKRAALTNLTPNHLDWHKSFEEYKSVKLALLEKADEPVLNADDPALAKHFKSREVFAAISDEVCFKELRKSQKAAIYFTKNEDFILRNGKPLVPLRYIRVKEKHNIKNLMCSIALCDGYAGKDEILSVAKDFSGLEHRCECFFSYGGIDFINSSIDSTPQRTINTLTALNRQVVIILGGRGKGLSYEPIIPALKKYARLAIVSGENKEDLARAASSVTSTVTAENLSSAISLAARSARVGEAVILSPASTSYDAFSNFEERGNFFKKTILEIYKNH